MHSLPMRSSPTGTQIDTRPLYIEEWLDSLPYIDFKKTSQLLYEATRLTNEQALKPAVRLELVELYGRPYQYYIDSQIKAGAQHTLQSIETMQGQIQILKKIAFNLGLACKVSAEETLKKKTLWGQTRPPLLNLLLSLNYLSHVLIFSFLEYAPTPKNVWHEINFIYAFAESLGQENNIQVLPKTHSKQGATSIAQAYKRIVLAALADPHHLPYGAIWEIFEQLQSWVDLVKISKFSMPDDPSCQFITKLDTDSPPLPYVKFDTSNGSDKHRMLDGAQLTLQIQSKLSILEKGGNLDNSVHLSPYFAKLILGHMARSWGLPSKRTNPRKEREGTVEIACGLNAAYYFLNNEKEFSVTTDDHADEAGHHGVDSSREVTPLENYKVDQWSMIDQSSRGFAVIKNIKPTYQVRVGDLIIINTRNPSSKWAIGVIRWLMIRQSQIYKIGVQILSVKTVPGAVRARSGSSLDTQYRRALLTQDQTGKQCTSVITSKGMYINNRELEIMQGTILYKANAGNLLESTTGFEQFNIINPA